MFHFNEMTLFAKVVSSCSMFGFIPVLIIGSIFDEQLGLMALAIQLSSLVMMIKLIIGGKFWKN